jgi:MYXO-CTERM domain-containing protein
MADDATNILIFPKPIVILPMLNILVIRVQQTHLMPQELSSTAFLLLLLLLLLLRIRRWEFDFRQE